MALLQEMTKTWLHILNRIRLKLMQKNSSLIVNTSGMMYKLLNLKLLELLDGEKSCGILQQMEFIVCHYTRTGHSELQNLQQTKHS